LSSISTDAKATYRPGASLRGPLHLPIAIDDISDCEV
jgi:hypothetical protein